MRITVALVSGASWRLRCAATVLATTGFLLLAADPADAHVGEASAADNFSGALTSVDPALPEGISMEVIEFGRSLRLAKTSDEVISVPGYSAEPYLQIGPEGVLRNENSPATYRNISGPGTVALPARADPNAEPSWERVSEESAYQWPDHRIYWTADSLPPEVLADPGSPHQVMEWTIQIEIGGRTYDASGVLSWTPPPPGWLSYLILMCLIAAGLVVGWVWRSPRMATALLCLRCAASVWHTAGTLLAQGSAASAVSGLLTLLVPTTTVLVLTFFAIRAVRELPGTEPSTSAPYLFGIAGWVMVAESLPALDVLFRANVLTIGPAWVARLTVLLLLGLGLGLALGSFGLLTSKAKALPDMPREVATT